MALCNGKLSDDITDIGIITIAVEYHSDGLTRVSYAVSSALGVNDIPQQRRGTPSSISVKI